MGEPIDVEYFNWLCAKVCVDRSPVSRDVLHILHQTEFVWIIAGDRNRADDGCELRIDFLRLSGWDEDLTWLNQPCSVLELLIAFSDRASFQTGMPAIDWFWEFMANLNLAEYGQVSAGDIPIIEDILQTFIWRTYDETGYGGIMPMRGPAQDQRKVEIWIQFSDYLEDRGLI